MIIIMNSNNSLPFKGVSEFQLMLASHIATNKSYEAFLAASPTSLVQRIASGKTANRNSRLLVSSILNMFIRQRNRGYNKT